MANWYGDRRRRVQLTSNTAVWYHSGKPVVPMRWVLLRKPGRRVAPQALLATIPQLRPAQSLTDVVRRWQMEATFEGARAHLGVETQRHWSDQATARTPPAWFALDSLMTLRAAHLIGTHRLPVRAAAWYCNAHATFSDTMALVGHCLWRQWPGATSQAAAEVVKIPRAGYERLTDVL
jgi:hypothetical protein